jgi:hypothetical protein
VIEERERGELPPLTSFQGSKGPEKGIKSKRVSIWFFPRTERPVEKVGVWEFATLSFPDHWHLAPNFTRRVSLAVSFPTLRWSAWTIASLFDSAAEPASVSPPWTFG